MNTQDCAKTEPDSVCVLNDIAKYSIKIHDSAADFVRLLENHEL